MLNPKTVVADLAVALLLGLAGAAGAWLLRRRYVHDQATAEEVVQEAWGAVLCRIARFQGRGSLRSWIYAILVNLARIRRKRDARVVPFAASGHRQDGPRHALRGCEAGQTIHHRHRGPLMRALRAPRNSACSTGSSSRSSSGRSPRCR
jgi:hypothetical protein